MHECNNSSVSVSQCCGWSYIVDDTGWVSLSVDDSLVPRIISVQYQCHNVVVGNMKLTSQGRYSFKWMIC